MKDLQHISKVYKFILIFSENAVIIRTDVPVIEMHVLPKRVKGRMYVLFTTWQR